MMSSLILFIISCLLYSMAFLFAAFFIVRRFWETRDSLEFDSANDASGMASRAATSLRARPAESDEWEEQFKAAVVEEKAAVKAPLPTTAELVDEPSPKPAIAVPPKKKDTQSGRGRIPMAESVAPEPERKPGDTRHDDSKETGQWFVENREILERLHGKLAGHQSSTTKRRKATSTSDRRKSSGATEKKVSLLDKHSSTADRIKRDRDRAQRESQLAEESRKRGDPEKHGFANKRPGGVLERHSSMNEKVAVTTREPLDPTDGAPVKKPTLLVKHASLNEKLQHDKSIVEANAVEHNDSPGN